MNTNIEVERQNGNFRRGNHCWVFSGKAQNKGQIEIFLPEGRFLSGHHVMCNSKKIEFYS